MKPHRLAALALLLAPLTLGGCGLDNPMSPAPPSSDTMGATGSASLESGGSVDEPEMGPPSDGGGSPDPGLTDGQGDGDGTGDGTIETPGRGNSKKPKKPKRLGHPTTPTIN